MVLCVHNGGSLNADKSVKPSRSKERATTGSVSIEWATKDVGFVSVVELLGSKCCTFKKCRC